MANFTFTVHSNKKTTVKNNVASKKKITVNLIKHDAVEAKPEHYLYVDKNGEKCKYSGIVSKDLDGSYIGKIVKTHKVILDYHPRIDAVKHVDEYFSYIDNNGVEKVFIGIPEFNLETNTYFGKVTENILQDEVVEIFNA